MSLSISEKAIIILGASGHARVSLDIFKAQGRNVLGFFDDDVNLRNGILQGYKILGVIKEALDYLRKEDIEVFVAIGDNNNRREIVEMIEINSDQPLINAIHPSAIISPSTSMGQGNFIAPGVIINSDTRLGSNTILNTGATIDHDNDIRDYAQVSPGCNLAGNVTIEEGAFLGIGTVVIPGKTIGNHAIVGAGAVVINDIPPFSTAVGVPARVIKQRRGIQILG